jgi:hypothetical protein
MAHNLFILRQVLGEAWTSELVPLSPNPGVQIRTLISTQKCQVHVEQNENAFKAN